MTAVREDHPLEPQSPYGVSKLMSEWMLRDASAAHGFRYTALRYFNVAGADPRGRTGQSTPGATHLLKVACETALGKRPFMQVYGTDYPTPDGTGIRDYIHVSDLVAAHRLALARLRAGGGNLVANCGYGHGYSVLELIDSVRRVHGRDFEVRMAPRRPGDPAAVIANSALARRELAGRRNMTISTGSSPMRCPGSASWRPRIRVHATEPQPDPAGVRTASPARQ